MSSHHRPHMPLTAGIVIILALATMIGMPRAVQGVGVTSTPSQKPQIGAIGVPPLANVAPGKIAHLIVKESERKDAVPVIGGPPHADPTYLFPDTTIGETWVIAGQNGSVDRAITYTKDMSGQLVTKAVVDGQGTTTLHNYRHGLTVTSNGKPLAVRDFDSRPTDLQGARSSQKFEQVAQAAVTGRDTVTLRDRATGKQYTFDSQTGGLLKAELLGPSGDLINSMEWQTLEVLDASTVPQSALSADVPQGDATFKGVPLRQLSRQDAATVLPFALYTFEGLPDPTVNYTTGTHVDVAAVPLPYRGIDALARRGDGVGFAYRDDTSKRYIEVREAPAERFALSLQASLPFWDSAKQITLPIGGKSVTGWYLTSTVQIRDSAAGDALKKVPGPSYIVLPDVNGTGISLMTQSYSEVEFIALAQKLRA